MHKDGYDIAVIGAGPAGMVAAIRAAELGAKVALVEKNARPGRKLLMTGGGRCNLTNEGITARALGRIYGRAGGTFLGAAFGKFGVAETLSFFRRLGVPTVVEDAGRVFPASGRAADVLAALLRRLDALGVELLTGIAVTRLAPAGGRITGAEHPGGAVQAGAYIVCTGGRSYPATGSSGEGFGWLRALGHTVTRLSPALSPVTVEEGYIKPSEGASLEHVRATAVCGNRSSSAEGALVVTGRGLSGPVILDISARVGEFMAAGETHLKIDLLPGVKAEELDDRLRGALEESGGRLLINSLAEFVPPKAVPMLMAAAGADGELRASKVSRKLRRGLVEAMKGLKLTVRGVKGFEGAMVMRGGVSLEEVDPATMRSKLVENLYLAGEALDLDGPTGGYNLQVCWTTGWVAGENAGRKM